MKKIDIILKLSIKFYKKYYLEYIKLLVKPILLGICGCLVIPLAAIHPILAIIVLFISIPCVCWGFWKGFVITYALNIAALNFIKKTDDSSIKDCYIHAQSTEADFAKYIGFFAFMTIIGYLPTIIYFTKIIPLNQVTSIVYDPTMLLGAMAPIMTVCTINTLILAPALNYATQAYLFRQENESYFQLILNCYKYLDKTGILIAFLITVITFLLSSYQTIVYILAFSIINVFVYSINTFWYYSKIAKIVKN